MENEKAGFVMPPDQVARMADLRRGIRKGRKIRRVLEEALAPAPWPGRRGLDVGCGPGTITAYLARYTGSFIGVDIDAAAITAARAQWRAANLTFVHSAAPHLPFPDASFDVVVVNHVYEHVREPEVLFAEVRRVLAPGGVVYLAAAGKYQIVEPHYGLPFLSWLPRRLANLYLKSAGRRESYDVKLLSYRRLMRFLKAFKIREYTAAVIKNPDRYAAGDVAARGRVMRAWGAAVIERLPALSPTRIMLLSRRDDDPE